jgi:hypothetical protein
MSAVPRSPIFVTLAFDPDEMARRGRLGAAVTHSRYDGRELTAPARAAFAARFASDDDRREYFRSLARKSAAARLAVRAGSEAST